MTAMKRITLIMRVVPFVMCLIGMPNKILADETCPNPDFQSFKNIDRVRIGMPSYNLFDVQHPTETQILNEPNTIGELIAFLRALNSGWENYETRHMMFTGSNKLSLVLFFDKQTKMQKTFVISENFLSGNVCAPFGTRSLSKKEYCKLIELLGLDDWRGYIAVASKPPEDLQYPISKQTCHHLYKSN